MDSGKTFRCPCCNRWLGHANPETTMQYIDKFWREKKEALEAWAKKLAPLGIRRLVGAPGFEPGTSCAQGKRATRLRHAPFNIP